MRAFSFLKPKGKEQALILPNGVERAKSSRHRILVLTLSNLSLQTLGFIYRMMLAKFAGSEALGLQSLVMQVYAIMVSVCISGLNVAVITLAARQSPNDAASIRRIVKNALILFVLLFLAMALPQFALREKIAGSLIGDSEAAPAISLVLACIFLTGIENILKSVHLAAGRVGTTAISELGEQSLRFLLVFLLLRALADGTDHRSVVLIVAGMLGSEVFSVSYLTASFNRVWQRNTAQHIVGSSIRIWDLTTILIPAALTGIAGTIFASAAALMLPGRLIAAGYTRSQALASIGTLNAVAMPLVMLPMTFVGAVAAVTLPETADSFANGDVKRVKAITKQGIAASVFALAAVNLPLLTVLDKIAFALFGLVPTKLCFLLLTIKAGIIYLQTVTTAVLNGMMKQKSVLVYTIIGEFSQLVLIYFLASIKTLHIYGYLAAMCIGEGIRLLLSLINVKKLLK